MACRTFQQVVVKLLGRLTQGWAGIFGTIEQGDEIDILPTSAATTRSGMSGPLERPAACTATCRRPAAGVCRCRAARSGMPRRLLLLARTTGAAAPQAPAAGRAGAARATGRLAPWAAIAPHLGDAPHRETTATRISVSCRRSLLVGPRDFRGSIWGYDQSIGARIRAMAGCSL